MSAELVASMERLGLITRRPMTAREIRRLNRRPAVAVADCVARHYGFPCAEALSIKTRRPEIAWPRQVAMTLICEYAGGPSASAAVFGLTHGSAIHAAKVVANRASAYPEVAADLNTLRKLIETQ